MNKEYKRFLENPIAVKRGQSYTNQLVYCVLAKSQEIADSNAFELKPP